MNTDRIITIPDLANKFVEFTKSREENPDAHRGARTHIPELNKVLGGFGKNWFVVIGGKQKTGKTAFKISLGIAFERDGRNVFDVSLEMSDMQMAQRQFANMTGVTQNKFRDIQLDESDWKEIFRIQKEMQEFRGHFGFGGFFIEDIAEIVYEYKPEILFVDYVQLLRSRKSHGGRPGELEYISHTLNDLKHFEGGRTIVGFSQRPSKSGLIFKGSSAFEQDADVAMLIEDVIDPAGEVSPEYKEIVIKHSRHSDTASFKVAFDGARSLVAGSIIEDPFMTQTETIDLNEQVEAAFGPTSYQRKKREGQ
jgi:replicative DNA helicase